MAGVAGAKCLLQPLQQLDLVSLSVEQPNILDTRRRYIRHLLDHGESTRYRLPVRNRYVLHL